MDYSKEELEYRGRAYKELVAAWHDCKLNKTGDCAPLMRNGKPFVRIVHPDDVPQTDEGTPIKKCEQLGLTTVAQPSLMASVVIIGQDWGSVKNYRDAWSLEEAGTFQGFGKPYTKNPSLINLGKAVGAMLNETVESRDYLLKEHKEIFLVNSMLCLKQGLDENGRDIGSIPIETGNYRKEWTSTCARRFIPSILDIIRPKAVITMGEVVTRSLIEIVEQSSGHDASLVPMEFETVPKNVNSSHLIDLVKSDPMEVVIKKTRPTFNHFSSFHMFPVFHCGARGVFTNRGIEEYCFKNQGNKERSELREDYRGKGKEERLTANCGKTSTELYLEDWRRIGRFIGTA